MHCTGENQCHLSGKNGITRHSTASFCNNKFSKRVNSSITFVHGTSLLRCSKVTALMMHKFI